MHHEAARDRRLARGWTQAQLAAMLGMPQSALSAIESGRRTLTRKMADRLSAAFAAAPVDHQRQRPTKQQRNREDYLAHQAERQAAARKRNREIRDSWKTAIAAWDRLHEWTSPPPDWEATGASQHAVTACCTHPIDLITEDAD
jgi:transcriptional regulator with XRE-family HTH domain